MPTHVREAETRRVGEQLWLLALRPSRPRSRAAAGGAEGKAHSHIFKETFWKFQAIFLSVL